MYILYTHNLLCAPYIPAPKETPALYISPWSSQRQQACRFFSQTPYLFWHVPCRGALAPGLQGPGRAARLADHGRLARGSQGRRADGRRSTAGRWHEACRSRTQAGAGGTPRRLARASQGAGGSTTHRAARGSWHEPCRERSAGRTGAKQPRTQPTNPRSNTMSDSPVTLTVIKANLRANLGTPQSNANSALAVAGQTFLAETAKGEQVLAVVLPNLSPKGKVQAELACCVEGCCETHVREQSDWHQSLRCRTHAGAKVKLTEAEKVARKLARAMAVVAQYSTPA